VIVEPGGPYLDLSNRFDHVVAAESGVRRLLLLVEWFELTIKTLVSPCLSASGVRLPEKLAERWRRPSSGTWIETLRWCLGVVGLGTIYTDRRWMLDVGEHLARIGGSLVPLRNKIVHRSVPGEALIDAEVRNVLDEAQTIVASLAQMHQWRWVEAKEGEAAATWHGQVRNMGPLLRFWNSSGDNDPEQQIMFFSDIGSRGVPWFLSPDSEVRRRVPAATAAFEQLIGSGTHTEPGARLAWILDELGHETGELDPGAFGLVLSSFGLERINPERLSDLHSRYLRRPDVLPDILRAVEATQESARASSDEMMDQALEAIDTVSDRMARQAVIFGEHGQRIEGLVGEISRRLEDLRKSETVTSSIEYIPEEPPFLDRFFDREELLDRLDEVVQRARLVVLTGVAGIGKTQVAARVKARLQAAGRPAFWHRFVAGEDLATVRGGLAAFLASRGYGRPARLLLQGVDDRTLEECLRAELRNDDCVIFLDNIEAADDPAIGAFFLEITSTRTGVTIVVTSRVLPSWIRGPELLNRTVSVEEVSGFPLDVTRAYFQQHTVELTDRTIEMVHERVQGHPLLLDLVLSQIVSYGLLDEDVASNFEDLTEEVDRYLLDNIVADLDAVETETLQYLAVSLLPLSLADLVSLMEHVPRVLMKAALASLERRRLVRRSRYEFIIHAIVRDFVYRNIGDVQRTHLRVAELLDQRPQHTPTVVRELCRHFSLAGHDHEAFSHLIREFSILWSGGHRTWSRDVLVSAAENARAACAPSRELVARLLVGRLCLETCEWGQLEQIYERAVKLAKREGDQTVLAQIANNRAEVLARRGYFEEAQNLYQTAISVLVQVDDKASAVVVRFNFASMLTRYGLVDAARTTLLEVIDYLTAKLNPLLGAKVASLEGLIALERGDVDAAATACSIDLDLCRELGDLNGSSRVQNNLAILELAGGDMESAVPHLEEVAQLNREQGDLHAAAQARGNLGTAAQLAGEGDIAAGHYATAWSVFTPIRDEVSLVEIEHNMARLPTNEVMKGKKEGISLFRRRGVVWALDGDLRFLWNVSYGYLPLSW